MPLAAFTLDPSPPGRRAHLIGIGGTGMQALADVLRGQGWRVSGSDLTPTRQNGEVFLGHRAEQVPAGADLVVYSEAITPENCERRQAVALGLQVMSYPAVLAAWSRIWPTFAVAGTHGKSTVTALAAEILQTAGVDPTVICGATRLGSPSGGQAGKSSLFLVEACEYRGHFLGLKPRAAAILGIEPDHFDAFPTAEALEAAFSQFIDRISPDGLLLVNADCPATMRLVANAAVRYETFALQGASDWRAEEIAPQGGYFAFQLCYRQQCLGRVQLRIAGEHNVLNALAAAALAHAAGVDLPQLAAGLGLFPGLQRRLEVRPGPNGTLWIDDYAHHPTEVTAALAAVRQLEPAGRLWCVFQPHQASRTGRLLKEFAKSLENVDNLAIAEIFRAREGPPLPGDVTAADLAECLRRRGQRVLTGHTITQIAAWLEAAIAEGELTPGDKIITMGAGDIGKLAYGIRDRIGKHCAAG